MRLGLLVMLPLAAKGCAPELDPGEHRGAYLIALGGCAFAVLLLVILRAVSRGDRDDEEPRDRDGGP